MMIDDTLETCYEALLEKLEATERRNKGRIPYMAINSRYSDMKQSNIYWWTNGFFSGIEALMYSLTSKESYLENLQNTQKALGECLVGYSNLQHDVGFLFIPTSVASYKLTGDQESRTMALHAASLLAGRFNPAGNYIRAWNDSKYEDTRGWSIIDTMMNLSLLYWASETTGDPRFANIARLHTQTVMRHFVREDYSVCHIVQFNPYDGSFEGSLAGQGYAEGSSWTRGQGWALYGFVIGYLHTHNKEYLDVATGIANRFISQIPSDYLIPIDFLQPKEPCCYDDSASALASSALITLSRITEDAKYEEVAIRLLGALIDNNHADMNRDDDGILRYCSRSYTSSEKHCNLIYGDFFFVEAILKVKGQEFTIW